VVELFVPGIFAGQVEHNEPRPSRLQERSSFLDRGGYGDSTLMAQLVSNCRPKQTH
jgi:hypothetical protein